MQSGSGRIGLRSRALFVFRDSSMIAPSIVQLSMTSQTLNTALTTLSSTNDIYRNTTGHREHSDTTLSASGYPVQDLLQLPPSYQDSAYMNCEVPSSHGEPTVNLFDTQISDDSLEAASVSFATTQDTLGLSLTGPFELSGDHVSQSKTCEGLSQQVQIQTHCRRSLVTESRGNAQLGLPNLCREQHLRRARSSDDGQLLFTPNILPYPSGHNDVLQCYRMPDQEQYQHHPPYFGAPQLSAPFLSPPYPVFELDYLKSRPPSHRSHQKFSDPFDQFAHNSYA
jgi:hypothetical protein